MTVSTLTTKKKAGKPVAKPTMSDSNSTVLKPEKLNKERLKVNPETTKQPAKDDDNDDNDTDGEEEEDDDNKDQDMEDASGTEEDDEDDDDEDEDDEDEDEDEDDEDEDEDDEDEDEDSDDDESDEETPKVLAGRKRPMPESATKTPGTDKKANIVTPEGHKPDNVAAREYWESLILAGKRKEGEGKKNVHVATPRPGAKQGSKMGKETAGGSKQQTPASKEILKSNSATPGLKKKGGVFNCQACKRNFNSEVALGSHNAAKHGGK